MSVRPWSVDRAGVFTPVTDEDCCETRVPSGVVLGDASPWFSCIGPRGGRPAELVSGRYWVDAGTVQWTIDLGSQADPELIHTMAFDDPTATDAWIPGNACRGSAGPSVALVIGDDHRVTAESLAAFNAWLAVDDDVDRRFVRLREALGIADAIAEASGPYREDVGEEFIELHGLNDDSVAKNRWDFSFSDNGSSLLDVALSWACEPDRGHDDFSTELCA